MALQTQRKSFKKNNLLYSSLFVIIVFILTRLPFFLYYPVTTISYDSASYCAIALNILESNIPVFEIRTPGYPLFLSAVWVFSKTFFLVSLIQSLFTIITSIFFLWVLNQYYRKALILFAVLISVFISSSYYMVLETSILTEGLFVNLILLVSAFLILAVKKNSVSSWALFSLTIAVTVIVRPAGIFLCSLIVLLLIYFFIKKFKVKYYVSLVAPFFLIIISLCLYNYVTLKSFTLTPFGESNMSGLTITFMEPSPEYPEYVNDAINKVLATIPKKDAPYVKESFGVNKLYNIFLNNYGKVITLTDYLINHDSASPKSYTEMQPVLRNIYIDAIKKYPELYVKFFLVNFYQFFMNINKTMGYYSELAKSYKGIVVEKKFVNALDKGGWQQVSSDKEDYEKVKNLYLYEIDNRSDFEYISVSESGEVLMEPAFFTRVYELYEKIYNFLFRNMVWLILFSITFSISIYKLIRSRFSNSDALIFFLLGVMLISKALLVSAVECSLERYSYPVEFVFYFSLPFLIILLKNSKNNLPQKN